MCAQRYYRYDGYNDMLGTVVVASAYGLAIGSIVFRRVFIHIYIL